MQTFAGDSKSSGYFILSFFIASEDTLFLLIVFGFGFFFFFAYASSLSLPQASFQRSTDSVFSIKYLGLTSPRLCLTAPHLSAVSLCLPANSSHSPLLLLIFLHVCF